MIMCFIGRDTGMPAHQSYLTANLDGGMVGCVPDMKEIRRMMAGAGTQEKN